MRALFKCLFVFCCALWMANSFAASNTMTCDDKDGVCKLNIPAMMPSLAMPEAKPGFVLTKDHPSDSLSLKGNPTTGYIWSVGDYDKNLVTVTSQYIAPNTRLIGAGGTYIFTFTANKNALKSGEKHLLTIELTYARPWEKNQAPAEKDQVVLEIN